MASFGARNSAFIHGEADKTELYAAWQRIKQRCCDPNKDNYPRYGGRGIVAFVQMGQKTGDR